jgi:type IV pilus assembly protein PilA
VTFDHGQGGAITSVEAVVVAVMTAILVAIAVPSYLTIRDRDSDSAARGHLRQAGEAAEEYRADHGSYTGMSPAALGRQDSRLAPSDYRVTSLGRGTYCLQTTVRGRTWHLVAPAGDLRRGSC